MDGRGTAARPQEVDWRSGLAGAVKRYTKQTFPGSCARVLDVITLRTYSSRSLLKLEKNQRALRSTVEC